MEYGTVSDKKIVKIIQNFNPDLVIHLAAFSGLKKCEENPEMAFDTNVVGTSNVIEGCLQANAKLVFISTREVYGLTNTESYENDTLNPINVYGKTKMQAEKLIQNASEQHGLNYTILRLTNVYGPKGNSGINKLIQDALKNRKIFVNGGEQILNFVFLDPNSELSDVTISETTKPAPNSRHNILNGWSVIPAMGASTILFLSLWGPINIEPKNRNPSRLNK